MLKLRIINKPKMYKLKCNFTFPNIILANMQEKEVTPTKEIQEVIPDIQYDGLSNDEIQQGYLENVLSKNVYQSKGYYDALNNWLSIGER